MSSVFLDTNVLFAATYSPTGASRELLKLGLHGKVQLVVSREVLEEARRNVARKLPEYSPILNQLLDLIEPEVVADPSQVDMWAAEEYVAQKGAPIVAAAINARVDFWSPWIGSILLTLYRSLSDRA